MPLLRPYRQYRRLSYQCYDFKYLLIFIIIILATTYFSIYFPQHGNVKSYHDTSDDASALKKQMTLKDNFHLVSAASSNEYQWLLEFIDSLVIYGGQFELLLWSIDLRDCEFNYLKQLRTPFRIHLHQFPFHFHPLHIRYFHLTAIKPIILESSALTFGQVIWIEPNNAAKLPLSLDNMVEILNDKGFIAASGSKPLRGQCATVAIGVNVHRYKNLIKGWAECAKSRSCIEKELNKAKPQPGVDMLFEVRRTSMKFPCIVLDSKEKKSLETSSISSYWNDKKQELCKPYEACVLTGSHQSHGCLTPQLGRLRRNKEKYTSRHGYVYFEETFGFHRHAPCHRVWNKVHAILKYLGDCKILFWVDTDAVFTDMDKTLGSFFYAYPDKEFLVSWPLLDEMLNAGVLLMRNTPAVRELFVNITHGKTWTNYWCVRDKFEQAALRDQLNSASGNRKFLVERSNTFLQTLCSMYNRECILTDKDYIAHFAPPNCPKLHDLVKNFLDKYPQLTS